MRSPRNSIVPLVTSPRSARSRLEIAFSVVVLPAPLAPSSATMPPSGTVERHALQHEDHVVVDDLDVVDRKRDLRAPASALRRHRGHRRRPRALTSPCEQSRGVMLLLLRVLARRCPRPSCAPARGRGHRVGVTLRIRLPSHCWNFTMPEPSWSSAARLDRREQAGGAELLQARLGRGSRCSRPQRTCSAVITLPLPNFSCAMRIASTMMMP